MDVFEIMMTGLGNGKNGPMCSLQEGILQWLTL